MVTLSSEQPLIGWKYPIFTDMDDKPVIDALLRAGVRRELILSNSDPDEIQLFDFVASRIEPLRKLSLVHDMVEIAIVVNIENGEYGIGMNPSEVVSIHLNPTPSGSTDFTEPSFSEQP